MQYQFESHSDTDLVIPIEALNELPFKEEGINNITSRSDIARYLFKLYDATGYGAVAENYLAEALELFESWACIFQKSASEAIPAPGAAMQNIQIPIFMENPTLGQVLKSLTAWQNTIGNILSEGTHFSLAHILESELDLKSSIHLAAHLYYRQSLQVLRGFLESVVLPVYFCGNPSDYKKWKNNDYITLSLRGKSGLLHKLTQNGILPQELSSQTATLYGALNKYIHGSESALNNVGLYSGMWQGFVFKTNEYSFWGSTFSKCIEVGLKILRIHHKQWEHSKKNLGIFCNICHSPDLVATELETEPIQKQYTCKHCGSKMCVDSNDKLVFTTTIHIDNN